MKKISLFITTLFSLVICVNAQNSSPYWSLAGNSNATSASKLGTTNAINLRLFTNNFERMRITTSGLVGIGTTSPTTKLQVNSASGTDVFRAQVNGATKLLVHSGGGVAIGANTVPPSNGLYVLGNVGIGTNIPSYKLHVVGTIGTTNGLYSTNGGITSYNSNTSSYGVYGTGTSYGLYGYSANYGVYGSGGAYGVYGTGTSYGVWGRSSNLGVYGQGGTYGVYGTGTYALYGLATGSTSYGAIAYGGYIGAFGNGPSYGLYGSSANIAVYGSGTNYGVWGNATGTTGLGGYFYSASYYGIRVKTGRTDKNWAGVFDGNVYTFGAYQTSDRNLKKNIEDFGDATSIINKLKPRSYEFRKDGKLSSLHLPAGKHYGLIAQELEEVLPNLVKEVDNDIPTATNNTVETKIILPPAPGKESAPQTPQTGTGQVVAEQNQATEKMTIKSINYIELIPVMIKAMQEQEATIKEQNAKIEALTKLVNKLQNANPEPSVKLSGVSLGQNSPNPPVANSTIINYNIPSGSATAELVFTNAAGQKVKQIQLNRNGAGLIDIDTSSLSAGTYFYTLYVNGKSFDTKKMIVAR